MELMELLLTNDDGLYAPGIRALASELEKIAVVTVIAPDRERSATGHAITVHHPLRVDEVELMTDGKVRAYMVNGTPSDCVKLGVEALLEQRPDIVVSGINRGPNLGTDVLYSGTVSAALEGLMLGIPSIAVSLATFDSWDYSLAASFTAKMVKLIESQGLPPETLLNINVPSLEPGEIAGVRWTRLGTRKYRKVFDKRSDPRGRVYYWLAGELEDEEDLPDADTTVIRNNMISVTPLSYNLTNQKSLEVLTKLALELN